jgi:hypothetical protein
VRQRLAVVFVVGHQPGRRGLAARQDCGDELVAQRAGKGKLRAGRSSNSTTVSLATSTVGQDPRTLGGM